MPLKVSDTNTQQILFQSFTYIQKTYGQINEPPATKQSWGSLSTFVVVGTQQGYILNPTHKKYGNHCNDILASKLALRARGRQMVAQLHC